VADTSELLSARNPNVLHLRRLTGRRRARAEHGQFVVEGAALVRQALQAGVAIETIYVDGAADPGQSELAAMLTQADAAEVRVRWLAAGVLGKVTDAVTPQGAAAVAAGRPTGLEQFLGRAPQGLVVVLAGVGDPGNAGTLVRTAEATGATAVVFCEGSVDPLGPKTIRASAGSSFRMPLVAGPDAEATVRALRAGGWPTLGTAGEGGVDLDAIDWPDPVVVVLGAESAGLSAAVVDQLDQLVTIPMAGQVESLNVGVAGSLVCFEWARKMRPATQHRS
jgi:RNA methyltransferase, TrmH family